MNCDRDFFVEINDDCSKVCVNANNSLSPVRGQGVAEISLEDNQAFTYLESEQLFMCT